MPYKQHVIKKKFFTISEVANKFNVNTSLIRFWESEFEQLKPTKNKSGNRKFTEQDISIIGKIYHLVKEKGFTLQGAKEQLATKKKKYIKSNIEIIDKLKELKKYLIYLESRL